MSRIDDLIRELCPDGGGNTSHWRVCVVLKEGRL